MNIGIFDYCYLVYLIKCYIFILDSFKVSNGRNVRTPSDGKY